MRLSCVFLMLFVTGAWASEHYPYSALITDAAVEVRSGPDAAYYPTSVLRQGDRVEVYYETDAWCAIRPPKGSFSWISARYVDPESTNIGSVAADGLASRVGSELKIEGGELCDTVQVKLKRGEKVLLLGRLETPENPASPLWLKIAPPCGEFRWIPRSALMQRNATASSVTASPVVTPRSKQRPIVQVVYAEAEESTSPPVEPVKAVETLQMPELPPLSEKLASSRPDRGSLVVDAAPLDPFKKAFEELKNETRLVLTRPTEDWVFETLIHRGNELYEIAPTEQDLERVYHLVETLQRTRAVRQEIAMRRQFRTSPLLTPPPSALPSPATASNRYASNTVAPRTSSVVPASLPRTAAPATEARHTLASTGVRGSFDVSGKLGEFEEPLPKNHPPYALVDEREQIVCLVTPATGVDLKQHIGKVIGVNGILGRFERSGKPNARHITAQTVGVISD